MVFISALSPSLTVTRWILLGAGTIICYLLLCAVYNLFFSPLAHIPGPFFAKISGLPSWYHTSRGDRHIWIWQCHQIYGNKVRICPNTVVFLGAQAHRDIYGARSNVTRSSNYDYWQRNETDIHTLNTSDKGIHRKKRRLLNLVLTEKSVNAAGLFIQEHVDRWNELLADGEGNDWSQPKNMSGWSDYLFFDILCDLCFGRSFNLKEPGENQIGGVAETIHAYMKFNYPLTRSPLLGVMLWLKPRGLNQLIEYITPPDVKAYYTFLEESIAARTHLEETQEKLGEGQKTNRHDLFHFIHKAKDPETGQKAYTQQDFLPEANLLVVAGSETTGIHLCGFLFYLVRNPRPYEKVLKEIRGTFESAEEIAGGPKLSSCKYLRACLNESMRMTPAVPGELSRTILSGGLTVDGEFFPAGISVSTSGWSDGYNDEFGDPNSYRPERWIVDEDNGMTAEEVKRISALVHPFGAGWSNCVGQNLAIMELLTVTARTLYRLDVREQPGSTLGQGSAELVWGRQEKNQFQLFDYYTAERDGPMLQFKRRHD